MKARHDTISVALSRLQRLRLWLRGVAHALFTMPPTHETRWKRLLPGEPGYDQAPFEEQWAMSGLHGEHFYPRPKP